MSVISKENFMTFEEIKLKTNGQGFYNFTDHYDKM